MAPRDGLAGHRDSASSDTSGAWASPQGATDVPRGLNNGAQKVART
jgi:hypothetical protein